MRSQVEVLGNDDIDEFSVVEVALVQRRGWSGLGEVGLESTVRL